MDAERLAALDGFVAFISSRAARAYVTKNEPFEKIDPARGVLKMEPALSPSVYD
jgi:hypothetical protein